MNDKLKVSISLIALLVFAWVARHDNGFLNSVWYKRAHGRWRVNNIAGKSMSDVWRIDSVGSRVQLNINGKSILGTLNNGEGFFINGNDSISLYIPNGKIMHGSYYSAKTQIRSDFQAFR